MIFRTPAQRNFRRLVWASYGFALLTMLLLLGTRDVFVEQPGQELWVRAMPVSLPYMAYCVFILAAGLVVLYNVLSGVKVRASTQNRYFLITTILIFNLVGYGLLTLVFAPPVPRLLQDMLVFTSVILLGIAVARPAGPGASGASACAILSSRRWRSSSRRPCMP